jgi:hypothetical protein
MNLGLLDFFVFLTHHILEFLLLQPELDEPFVVLIAAVCGTNLQDGDKNEDNGNYNEVEDAIILEMDEYFEYFALFEFVGLVT